MPEVDIYENKEDGRRSRLGAAGGGDKSSVSEVFMFAYLACEISDNLEFPEGQR